MRHQPLFRQALLPASNILWKGKGLCLPVYRMTSVIPSGGPATSIHAIGSWVATRGLGRLEVRSKVMLFQVDAQMKRVHGLMLKQACAVSLIRDWHTRSPRPTERVGRARTAKARVNVACVR